MEQEGLDYWQMVHRTSLGLERYMGDYIYCSIGTLLSERTMRESNRGELGRDLLWIMKGSVNQEWKYHLRMAIAERGPYHKRQYGNGS